MISMSLIQSVCASACTATSEGVKAAARWDCGIIGFSQSVRRAALLPSERAS